MSGPRLSGGGSGANQAKRRCGEPGGRSGTRSSGTTEPGMRAYIDSDILIWHLRGEEKAAALLRRLSGEPGTDLWVGALQRAEIVCFMRPREVTVTRSLLSRF